MNNIEILEEFIKHYKEVQEKYKDDEIQAEIERSCYFEEVPAEAIENLIKEYKELEEKNKILESLLQGNLFEMYKYYKELCSSYQGNSISKDKVKEKIKELDKKMAEDEVDEFGIHSQGWAALDWTRDFLLELLVEGE